MQQEEIIRNNVEKAIENEKDRYESLKQDFESQKIQIEVKSYLNKEPNERKSKSGGISEEN